MSDDSSSEDEITKRILKDSIDKDLLTNDLYKNGAKKCTEKTKCTNPIQTKPSLRYIIEDEGHDNNLIKVTPEFQEFVAKNLFKHLESKIIENEKKHKKRHIDNIDDHPKGIHLFNGSTKLLNHVMDEPVDTINKRKRHHKVTSNQIILQRALEAAVTPEWILNKDAVQGWAKVSKGKIMEIKKNNDGSYDIINDGV